jgi:hypothetical protein
VRTGNNQADLEGKPLQVVQAATVMAVRSGAARADHRAWGPDRRPDDSRAAARSGSPLTVTPTDDQASGAGPRRKESFRHTGRVTLGAFREEQAARILLREAIAFGLIEQTEHGQGLAQEVNETA